jgi:hypothetical protein
MNDAKCPEMGPVNDGHTCNAQSPRNTHNALHNFAQRVKKSYVYKIFYYYFFDILVGLFFFFLLNHIGWITPRRVLSPLPHPHRPPHKDPFMNHSQTLNLDLILSRAKKNRDEVCEWILRKNKIK